jgi:outer membrane biosynthesis protein TonB
MTTRPCEPAGHSVSARALFGAALLAALLFLLLPVTQWLDRPAAPDRMVRTVEVLSLRPPPPPPPEIRPLENERLPEAPAVRPVQPAAAPPAELSVSLRPGPGAALVSDAPSPFLTGLLGGTGQIRDVFDFSDLDRPPNLLFIPPFDYPPELIRRRIDSGTVVLRIRIDTSGRSELEAVVSSTHDQLVPVAEGIVRRARFSVTEINGRPVEVRGEWPLTLQAPR